MRSLLSVLRPAIGGLAAFVTAASAIAGASAGELEILAVPADKRAKGDLYLAVYSNPATWMQAERAAAGVRLGPGLAGSGAVLRDLPPGKYAIAAFVDVNGDGKLNTNMLGIPVEPYGFSGSGGFLGTPDFDSAAVNVGAGPTQVRITLD